jgi:lipoyl(octanoyl) transferase
MTSETQSGPVLIRPVSLEVHDCGHASYEEMFERQRALQKSVIEQRRDADHHADHGADLGAQDESATMHLLLVEHDPPVITVSRRPGARQHLLATEAQLAAAGVTVAETNRGGDITYHGPGQLVVYPILDLNVINLRLTGYMRWLEQIVIDTIATFGVAGQRDACATGVWVGASEESSAVPPTTDPPAEMSKICAMGVRISRWVTMHGLALNVTTELSHFDLIVPCGLAGRTVTSLQRELGEGTPTMAEVKSAIVARFLRDLASTS